MQKNQQKKNERKYQAFPIECVLHFEDVVYRIHLLLNLNQVIPIFGEVRLELFYRHKVPKIVKLQLKKIKF